MRAYFIQLMLEDGILASGRFYPMLAHPAEHVERYLEAADRAFARVAEAKAAGRVRDMLVGGPAVAGFKRIS
jgi:glutamate-1-semialdehyde 2,1-aminomutase